MPTLPGKVGFVDAVLNFACFQSEVMFFKGPHLRFYYTVLYYRYSFFYLSLSNLRNMTGSLYYFIVIYNLLYRKLLLEFNTNQSTISINRKGPK